jgi:hypothetical protein
MIIYQSISITNFFRNTLIEIQFKALHCEARLPILSITIGLTF